MTSGLEHRECTESLGAYVLGALPDAESAQVELHLAACRECQAEVEWLRVAADALPASVPQIDPPPALKDRLMGIVEAEAELLRAAGQAADRPPRHWRPPRRRSRPFLAWRPAAALAAMGAVALTVVLATAGGGSGTRTFHAQLLGQALPGARASLVLRGTHAELVVSRLRVPTADHVDEVWIEHGSSPPVPAGTFVVTSGSIDVTRPVRSGDHVLVTVEPGRGTRAPTTPPFLVVHV